MSNQHSMITDNVTNFGSKDTNSFLYRNFDKKWQKYMCKSTFQVKIPKGFIYVYERTEKQKIWLDFFTHTYIILCSKTRRKRVKRLHSGTTSDKKILKFYEKLVIWVSYFVFGIFTCKYFTLLPKCFKRSNYFTMLPKHF